MATWYIELNPRAGSPAANDVAGGWLEIIEGTVEDAVEELDAWAESLQLTGYVPDCGDWRNRSPIGVGKRSGKGAKSKWRVRLDSWERETENGYDNGHGYLELREAL